MGGRDRLRLRVGVVRAGSRPLTDQHPGPCASVRCPLKKQDKNHKEEPAVSFGNDCFIAFLVFLNDFEVMLEFWY